MRGRKKLGTKTDSRKIKFPISSSGFISQLKKDIAIVGMKNVIAGKLKWVFSDRLGKGLGDIRTMMENALQKSDLDYKVKKSIIGSLGEILSDLSSLAVYIVRSQ